MGSSNRNETRKEHRLRDMPPLGPMQKKITCFEQIVAWGYFSTDFASVLVPAARIMLGVSYIQAFLIFIQVQDFAKISL